MKLRSVVLALLVLAAPAVAHASASSCQGLGDGTPCTTSCISSGFCMMNVCMSITLRPDGTACSTDNRCTTGDSCINGQCVAGADVVCPDIDVCHPGFCSPQFGCSSRNVCRPDLSTNPMDLAGVIQDMSGNDDQGVSEDLGDMGEPEDLTGVPNDMCTIPPGSEFWFCEGADGPYYLPLDGSLPPDFAPEPHVRGSRIGDCAFGEGALPGPHWVALIFAALLLLHRRSRRPS
jgi:hypothetical protein